MSNPSVDSVRNQVLAIALQKQAESAQAIATLYQSVPEMRKFAGKYNRAAGVLRLESVLRRAHARMDYSAN